MKLALDIGGTNTRIGIVNDSYKLLETESIKTDPDYGKGIKNIFDSVNPKDFRVSDICIGIAGVFQNGRLYSSPNLKGWIGKNLRDDFEKNFKCKVSVENDAALAGLGEAVFGAGKDYKIVSYITIGTGIGGARIVDKSIDGKVFGFEPGHMNMVFKTKGREETLSFENLSSGKSIKKIYGKDPYNIKDKRIWNEIIKSIAVGVSNAVYFWSPEIIVLGGGVSQAESFDIELLKKEMDEILLKTYPKIPDVKKSALGDFSGIWGGVAYLKNGL